MCKNKVSAAHGTARHGIGTDRDEDVLVRGLPPDRLVWEGPDGRRHHEGERERLEQEAARLQQRCVGCVDVCVSGCVRRGCGGRVFLLIIPTTFSQLVVDFVIHVCTYTCMRILLRTSGKTRKRGGYTRRSAYDGAESQKKLLCLFGFWGLGVCGLGLGLACRQWGCDQRQSTWTTPLRVCVSRTTPTHPHKNQTHTKRNARVVREAQAQQLPPQLEGRNAEPQKRHAHEAEVGEHA